MSIHWGKHKPTPLHMCDLRLFSDVHLKTIIQSENRMSHSFTLQDPEARTSLEMNIK